MIEIYFVDIDGDTITKAESENVPRIGELVSIRESFLNPDIEGYALKVWRVADVEWPVIVGPNGTYLQCFVTLGVDTP